MKPLSLLFLTSLTLTGCGANNTPPNTGIPGEKTSTTLQTLETGAQVIQSRPPIDAISAYLDGIPALMMGFTGEGQLDPALLADRDRRLKVNTQAIKQERADIVAHPVAPGANAWQRGEVIQLKRVEGAGEHGHGDTTHFGRSEQTKRDNP